MGNLHLGDRESKGSRAARSALCGGTRAGDPGGGGFGGVSKAPRPRQGRVAWTMVQVAGLYGADRQDHLCR